MPGVAFHASDVQLSANGPRVIIFGGQRQGISGAMYSFEQASGDGYVLMPEGVEGTGPPPPARTQPTLTSIGANEAQTQLILFGGFALNIGPVNDLWRVTILLDDASIPYPSWEALQPAGEPPSPRYGHSATLLGGDRIVYIGGQNDVEQFNDVFFLAPSSLTWSAPSVSGTPPSVRMKHTVDAIGPSTLLLFGGFNKADRCYGDAHTLTVDGDSAAWSATQLEPPPGSKPIPPRAQHATAAAKGGKFVFIFGGYDGTKVLNDLWVLDTSDMVVRNIAVETPAPEPRSRHTVHIISDLLHVFGGYDNSKPVSGDVYTLDCSDPSGMEAGGEGGGEKKKEDEKKDEDD